MPLLCLVGASNELPESEELDALYDRFLLRSSVEQVSAGSLANLLTMRAGSLAASSGEALGQMENARVPISIADFQGVKSAAEAAVDVPQNVVDLIVDLRAHLQNKCEPPVYVLSLIHI